MCSGVFIAGNYVIPVINFYFSPNKSKSSAMRAAEGIPGDENPESDRFWNLIL